MTKISAAGIALALSMALALPGTALAAGKADLVDAKAKPAKKKGLFGRLKGWWSRTKAKAKKSWGKFKGKAKKSWGKLRKRSKGWWKRAKARGKKGWAKFKKGAKGWLRKAVGKLSSVYKNVRAKIGSYVKKIGGKQGRAFLALARVLAEISRRANGIIKKAGGANVGLRKFYRSLARGYVAGAIKRTLRFGKGLGKWLQGQFKKQGGRLAAVAKKLKISPKVVKAYKAFGKRILSYVRAVASGKAKLSKSAIAKALRGYGKAFGPALNKLVRFAKAAPKRAKAIFKKFFGKGAKMLSTSTK